MSQKWVYVCLLYLGTLTARTSFSDEHGYYVVKCSFPTSKYEIQMLISDNEIASGNANIVIYEKTSQGLMFKQTFPVKVILIWSLKSSAADGAAAQHYIAGFRYRIGKVITFEVIEDGRGCESLLGAHLYRARINSNQPFFASTNGRLNCESRRLRSTNGH